MKINIKGLSRNWATLVSALAVSLLGGCGGSGADDVAFDYNPETLISENSSNEYVEPPRAPDGFKVIYYVDSGDGTPDKLEALETFGTRSSTEDQAYGTDAVTGFKWGYTSDTAQYYSDGNLYGSIRGDERDIAGEGIEYSFELENGSYTVVFGFNDPWDSEGLRHVSLTAEDVVLEEDYYIPVDDEFKRFDSVEVSDGVLNLGIKRNIANSDPEADPQISWIEIWGETDEQVAAPAAKSWIVGDFQVDAWSLSTAPQMTAVGDDWYEMTVHFQDAGGFKFFDQNQFLNADNWGVESENSTTITYSDDTFPIVVSEAGYYDIRFNITSLVYTITTSDLSALDPQNEMFVIGVGFPQEPDMNWDTSKAIPLIKNFRGMGEQVFGIEGLEFSDEVELKIINERSWDGMDIGFVNAAVYNETGADFFWGETISGSGTPNLAYSGAAGLYTLIFDYAANRATLFKGRMYLVGAGSLGSWDVGQAAELDQVDNGWFELSLRFTAEENPEELEKPYGDFKFVSEQSWDAGNFGLVDRSISLIEMINSGSSAGIPAPAPGYYVLRFNPESLAYSITAIDLEANPTRSEMFIVGKGYVDYPDLDWSVENAIPMSRDFQERGDYVFGLECLEFGSAVDMKFLGQLGWDGLDAGFVNGGEQTAPLVGVKADVVGDTSDLKLIDQPGFYDVSFDYLINRVNVIPNASGDCL